MKSTLHVFIVLSVNHRKVTLLVFFIFSQLIEIQPACSQGTERTNNGQWNGNEIKMYEPMHHMFCILPSPHQCITYTYCLNLDDISRMNDNSNDNFCKQLL